jgi:chemotaxis protein methyltransferase CheR
MSLAHHDFNYVSTLVRERSAIVLEPGKEYLVESRLMPLARSAGLTDVGALVARAQRAGEAELKAKIVDALTTNETSWFRDRHPFDALATGMLPQFPMSRASSRTLNIWSAACSSGQEPYSIAMTMLDAAPTLASWRTQITATDLSPSMVERARLGHYSQLEVNRGLPATHLVRHFEREGAGWKVKPNLRSMVRFEEHNLMGPAPIGTFDIVFIRNVLIYFSVQTKRDILAKVRRALAPDGYLVLGAAETTLNLDPAFERVEFGTATVYRLKNR